jgi:hypothetical protein
MARERRLAELGDRGGAFGGGGTNCAGSGVGNPGKVLYGDWYIMIDGYGLVCGKPYIG